MIRSCRSVQSGRTTARAIAESGASSNGSGIASISFTPQQHTALRAEDLGMYEMLKRDDRVVLELKE